MKPNNVSNNLNSRLMKYTRLDIGMIHSNSLVINIQKMSQSMTMGYYCAFMYPSNSLEVDLKNKLRLSC